VRGTSEIGRGRGKKRGNRTCAFPSRRHLVARFCYMIRTTNVRENPNDATRGLLGANFPRVIAPLHRSNSTTLKETARVALSSWFRVDAIESRNSFVISCVRGPETRSFSSERSQVFFYKKVATLATTNPAFLLGNGF
jgi:hypothetical protein